MNTIAQLYIQQGATYGNAIKGFAVTQIGAFLFLLLQNEAVRAGYTNKWLVIITVVIMALVGALYIRGIFFCHSMELGLLEIKTPPQPKHIYETVLDIRFLQAWLVAIAHLAGGGAAIWRYFSHTKIGLVSH